MVTCLIACQFAFEKCEWVVGSDTSGRARRATPRGTHGKEGALQWTGGGERKGGKRFGGTQL